MGNYPRVTEEWSKANGQRMVEFLQDLKMLAFDEASRDDATALTVFHVVGRAIATLYREIAAETDPEWEE